MSAERLIYADLDNNLIDTVRLTDDVISIAEEYGISREEYIHSVEELEKQHGRAAYSFEKLYSLITENKPMVSWEFLKRIEELISKNYFFPDAVPFLLGFGKNELTIITEGNREYQYKKINAHELEYFVGKIIIAGDGKEKAIIPGAGKTFLLDDAPRAIDAVKKQHPSIICIQMRTPPHWEKQKFSDLKDAHCKDLYEAAKFIKNYKD